MANFGCALKASKEEAQRMIAEAVAKSSNLAEAMECVGAMYGIPSSNILVDDDLKSVKVINDTIICPSNVGASNNTNTIIRSISSLLDQISSRIDEKLNGLQIGNVNDGQFKDNVLAKSDPSKGKVVATYKDSDGEPVLVYDSGIIDASNTPAGRQKAAELRASGNIPARDPLEKREPSYFTDEDDVMNGVPNIPSPQPTPQPTPTPNTPQLDQLKLTQPPMDKPNGIVEYSISDMIGESEYFIDAMSRFGGTSRLGTTIFTTQGYERILPDMNVVQEAVDVNKSTKMADLKHMKFDNKNLIKAINLLNKARAEQSNVKNVKDLDISRLINNPDYKAAISAIERQFDCHLNIRWYDLGPGDSDMMNVATVPTGIFDQIGVAKEITHKITISKSKGFQLGGSGVDVHVLGKVFDMLIPKEQDLFGQGFISIILHEMFHNIVAILRFDNVEFTILTKCAIENAIKCRNPKRRKEIVEKYVDCVNDQLKGKLSRVARRLVVRRLLGAIATESDDRLRDEYLKAVSDADSKTSTISNPDERLNAVADRMDKHAKRLERRVKGYKHRGTVWLVLGCVFSAIGLISSIVSIGHPVAVAASLSVALAGGGTIVAGGVDKHIWNNYKKICSTYEDSRKVEEYYCDLFASMYQLPPHFFLLGKYRANDVSKETLERYAKSESNLMRKHDMISDKLLHELETGCYPTDSERIWSSVTVAKKLLETGKCDPAVKRYLEWILSGDSQILDVGIEDNYNYHNFSPDEAKDLDKHLNNIASNKNIKVTEAAIDALTDTSEFVEWIKEGMEYSEEEKDYMEYFDLIDSYDKFIQEAQTMTSIDVTGYKGESVLKRILLAIPRLIGKLIQIVAKVIEKLSNRVMVGILKMFTPDKQYAVDYKLSVYASGMETQLSNLRKIHDKLSDVSDFNEFGKVCAKLNAMGVFGNLKGSDFISNGDKGVSGLKSPHGFAIRTHVNNGKAHIMYGRDIVKCVDRILRADEEIKPLLNRINDIITRFNDSNPEWINDLNSENAKGIQALYQWLSVEIADEKAILGIALGLQRVAYDSNNQDPVKFKHKREVTGVGVNGSNRYESLAIANLAGEHLKEKRGEKK